MENLFVKSTSGLFINFKGVRPEAGTQFQLPFLEAKKSTTNAKVTMETYLNTYNAGIIWVFADSKAIKESGNLYQDSEGTKWLVLTVAERTREPKGKLTKL